MSDSENDDTNDKAANHDALSFLMGNLIDDDMLGDAFREGVDDLLDLVADVDIQDGDENDETFQMASSASAVHHRMYVDQAVEQQTKLDEIRKFFGFGRHVRLEEVDVFTDVPPHAWLIDRKYARQHGEKGRVHEAIRRATDKSQTTRPELGRGCVVDTPTKTDQIVLPAWAATAPQLRASNTVSTVHTNCLPNQERFATNYPSTNFNRNTFAATKIRIDSTGLFFDKGSGVVAGAPGAMASRIACAQFVALLQRMDALPFELSSRLQNIVCNASCFRIDLEQLAQRYRLNTRYEVTRFPGLIFRPGAGPWVFIIFPEKIIGTGFTDWVEANLVWRWLFACVLCQFKDKKDLIQETAAEKKNRTYNTNASFKTALRAIYAENAHKAATEMLEDRKRKSVLDRDDALPDFLSLWKDVLKIKFNS